MIWSAVLAGISGALAGLLARLAIRNAREERGKYMVVFALVFVILNSASRTFVLPSIRAWRAKSEAARYLMTDPLWSLLVKEHPEVGEKFTELMVELARDGATSAEASARGVSLGRSILAPYFTQYAARASSASLNEYSVAMTTSLQYLEARDPAACFALLFGEGREGAGGISDLPAEYKQAMSNSVTAVIQSALTNPEASPAADEGARLLEELGGRLASEHDDRFMSILSQLSDPQHATASTKELCTASIVMYGEIMNTPEPSRSMLLRHLFSGAE